MCVLYALKKKGKILMENKTIKKTIKVHDTIKRIMNVNEINYISLTDLARYVNDDDPSGVIRN